MTYNVLEGERIRSEGSMKKNKYGLKKWHYARNKRNYLDYDYLDKLTPEEKEWLRRFSKEYYEASFDKDESKNIHKSSEQKKDCYDRNNRMNRDLYSILSSGGAILLLDPAGLNKITVISPENAQIQIIDLKKLLSKSQKSK